MTKVLIVNEVQNVCCADNDIVQYGQVAEWQQPIVLTTPCLVPLFKIKASVSRLHHRVVL